MDRRADTLPEPPLDDGAFEAGDRTDPHVDILSTTLPVNAERGFSLFCEVERTPEWVSVIRSAIPLERDPLGRPLRVAFLAILEQASLGYTLRYTYDPHDFGVAWETDPDGSVIIRGRAQFTALGPRASMMHYQLQLDVPAGSLPAWGDPFFDGHAASAILGDFRDFVNRSLPI